MTVDSRERREVIPDLVQQVWNAIDTLPPIDFSESEALALHAALVQQQCKPPVVAEDEVAFATHYGPRCRDCADEDGVCPASGIGCGEREKAVRFVLGAVAYGREYGFIRKPPVDEAVYPRERIARLCLLAMYQREYSGESLCDEADRIFSPPHPQAASAVALADKISDILANARASSPPGGEVDHAR
jgi:hypothetical protein